MHPHSRRTGLPRAQPEPADERRGGAGQGERGPSAAGPQEPQPQHPGPEGPECLAAADRRGRERRQEEVREERRRRRLRRGQERRHQALRLRQGPGELHGAPGGDGQGQADRRPRRGLQEVLPQEADTQGLHDQVHGDDRALPRPGGEGEQEDRAQHQREDLELHLLQGGRPYCP